MAYAEFDPVVTDTTDAWLIRPYFDIASYAATALEGRDIVEGHLAALLLMHPNFTDHELGERTAQTLHGVAVLLRTDAIDADFARTTAQTSAQGLVLTMLNQPHLLQ